MQALQNAAMTPVLSIISAGFVGPTVQKNDLQETLQAMNPDFTEEQQYAHSLGRGAVGNTPKLTLSLSP